MKQSSLGIIGLAAGIALGVTCGYMLFNRSITNQVMRKLNKSRKAIERAQAEWRSAANEVLEHGREQLDHMRSKSKRVLNEIAS
jgi:uncharacterized membrane-anchored protein YhcB (DUF1043 family)